MCLNKVKIKEINMMKQLILTTVAVFTAVTQALAVTYDFTAGEGFTDGSLNGQVGWYSAPENTVNTNNGGFVVFPDDSSQWKAGFAADELEASSNNTFVLSKVVSWTESAASGNNEAFNLVLNNAKSGSDSIRAYLIRVADTGYKLGLNVLGSTLGEAVYDETLFGINASGDVDSDNIEFSMEVMKGDTTNDWSYTLSLSNVASNDYVGVPITGTFSADTALFDASVLYGGFSSGRNVTSHGLTNRVVKSFSLASTYTAPPEPVTTIVQWGEAGGDLGIVAADQNIEVTGGAKLTYEEGNDSTANPFSAAYYTNVAAGTRSTIFNVAADQQWNTRKIDDDAAGDAIVIGQNKTHRDAMVVWESLLSEENKLATLAIEIKYFNAAYGGSYRFLIQKGSGAWYASEALSMTSAYSSSAAVNAADLDWYVYTPHDGGDATVGAAASIGMGDISKVGYYFEIDGVGGTTFMSCSMRYFQATATPGPSSATIIEWGDAGGATGIVSVDQNFDSRPYTFTEDAANNPAIGVDYYEINTNRSPEFNAVLENRWFGSGMVRNDDGVGDAIAITDDVTNHHGMVVWETFLDTPTEITGLSGEFYNHQSADFLNVRFVVEENGSWYISGAQSLAMGSYETLLADPALESWSAFTPMVDGVSVIGASVGSLPLTNVTAAGFYFEAENEGTIYHGLRARHFVVTGLVEQEPPPVEVVDFSTFSQAYGLSGTKTDDYDSDGLDDYGEYVFGGLPNDDTDRGVLPVLNSSNGEYVFSLIGDDSIVAHVVATDDLVDGSWTTNATVNVVSTNGALSAYTNAVDLSGPKLFFKLIVE